MTGEFSAIRLRSDGFAAAADSGLDAEAVHRQLIELEPNQVVGYTRLAKCLLARGETEAAEALYRRVLEFEPTSSIASNAIRRMRADAKTAPRDRDVDATARRRAAARIGALGSVTEPELILLVEAFLPSLGNKATTSRTTT